ncbi:MAG: hypothetical protein Ta2B_06740 [Termitinemataceae bacterium]|nr:MAG: hypothetical protein Ta2B_06740 [Termitinemataceae bacterium]
MPKPTQYKKGSFVYFSGDKNDDRVFVVQQGSVLLESIDPELNLEVHDKVAPGEFFGVKSALGNYPRDESAQAMQDSVIIVFSVSEFEQIATGNTRLIFKMLQVFSNQLRRVNKQLSSVLKQKETDPDDGLYNVGNFFLNQKEYSKALYIFDKYCTQYPQGKNINNSKKFLTQLTSKGIK